MDSFSDQLLTIKQVSKILQVSEPTIFRYMKDKDNPLPVMRITEGVTRIKRSALNSWLEEKVGSGLDSLRGGDAENGKQ